MVEQAYLNLLARFEIAYQPVAPNAPVLKVRVQTPVGWGETLIAAAREPERRAERLLQVLFGKRIGFAFRVPEDGHHLPRRPSFTSWKLLIRARKACRRERGAIRTC